MNRAVVVLLLLIANVIVSLRTNEPPGIAPASRQERPRTHSSAAENGRVASSRTPAAKMPGCRPAEEARAASWLRL